MKNLTFATSCALFLLLAGCSETPTQAPEKTVEAKKPPEPVSGRYALYQMFTAGRAWQADIEIMRMNSIELPEVKKEPGKAPAWQATFVSARSSRARTYTYSVIEGGGNLHKGVFAGLEEGWSGPRGANKPFAMAAIKTDSDAAWEVAAKKAVEYMKKNPDKAITYQLEKITKFPDPAWRVIWGESVSSSNYSIYVDASTGGYLETMR